MNKSVLSVLQTAVATGRSSFKECAHEAFLGALVLFMVAAAANTLLYQIARSAVVQGFEKRVERQAILAAQILDSAVHERLVRAEQTGSPDHLRLQGKLQALREAMPELDRLYSARIFPDGSARMILDTTSPGAGGSPRLIGAEIPVEAKRITAAREKFLAGSAFDECLQGGPNCGPTTAVPLGDTHANGIDYIHAEVAEDTVHGLTSGLTLAYGAALALSLLLAILVGLSILWLRGREFQARLMRPEDRDFFRQVTTVLPGLLYQARVAPDGQVETTYVSDASRKLFEVEAAELVPDPRAALSRIHPNDRKRLTHDLAQASWKSGTFREEFRVVLPEAGERWYFATSHVARLADGSTLWTGFIADLTWQKHAEVSLRRSEASLKAAQEVAGVGSWELVAPERGPRLLRWSDETRRLFGLPPGDRPVTEEHFLAHIHPEDRDTVAAAIRAALEDRTGFSLDHRISIAGAIRTIREDARVLAESEPDGTVTLLGTARDVTEEMRVMEAILSADRAKSEFLAMMSHEIRTPLNGVLGFASLLAESPLTAQQKDYVSVIQSTGSNLLHLINDILDLSKVESGEIRIQEEPLVLRDFVEDILQLLRPRAAEKKLAYGWTARGELPAVILADRGRLGQILTNLVGNAVKFTSAGSVQVKVSGTPRDDRRWELEFVVSDTGPGISQAAQQHIFEPFYQADLSPSRSHGGTGLGLPISRRLARLMDGDIAVTSTPGEGSRFVVRLTVAEAERAASNRRAEPEIVSATGFPGRKVLVVDDDAVNRRLCILQMGRLGVDASAASSGEEAIRLSQDESFSAILMDVQMPGMDGLEATRRIRAAGQTRVPIIACTANVMPQDREKCLAAGMDDYLAKPVQLPELAAVLKRWLSDPAG